MLRAAPRACRVATLKETLKQKANEMRELKVKVTERDALRESLARKATERKSIVTEAEVQALQATVSTLQREQRSSLLAIDDLESRLREAPSVRYAPLLLHLHFPECV